MDNHIKKYRASKIIMLEEDFRIHLDGRDYMRMVKAKTEFEIDNLMREIFNKYL